MAGSAPDLRGCLAGLRGGMADLVRFRRRIGLNSLATEVYGSDGVVEPLNLVASPLAERTSDFIDALGLLDAF